MSCGSDILCNDVMPKLAFLVSHLIFLIFIDPFGVFMQLTEVVGSLKTDVNS